MLMDRSLTMPVVLIDQPQPASALSKEEFALIFIIPLSPLLGIVVTEQRIAIGCALPSLCLCLFPAGDSFVKDTLVVIGDADALGIFIELNIIIVQIAHRNMGDFRYNSLNICQHRCQTFHTVLLPFPLHSQYRMEWVEDFLPFSYTSCLFRSSCRQQQPPFEVNPPDA